jgi:hypothetical protein
MSRKPNELTGKRFGYLTALERTDRQVASGLNYYWKCRCDCGTITEVNTANLHSGKVISCGCARNRRNYE